MGKIVECVPNFSEGKDLDKIEKIVECFRGKDGVKLLDYSNDVSHNRCVVTVVGEPKALKTAIVASVEKAVELIDLNLHQGQHPRMGAVDVIPFIPVKNITIEETDKLAKETAEEIWKKIGIPVYLYEKSASSPYRENLSNIRKGQFEGMQEKMKDEIWKPDYGLDMPHKTAGVVAVGARMPLIAYNIKLDTNNLEIADKISKQIRYLSGGFRYCKAIGVKLEERNIVEVSINLTDYSKTSIYRVFETVKMECKKYGVNVIGSEIIGLVSLQAMVDTVEYYLGLENFNIDQVLETRI
jgi:glutamate formiminotransferase